MSRRANHRRRGLSPLSRPRGGVCCERGRRQQTENEVAAASRSLIALQRAGRRSVSRANVGLSQKLFELAQDQRKGRVAPRSVARRRGVARQRWLLVPKTAATRRRSPGAGGRHSTSSRPRSKRIRCREGPNRCFLSMIVSRSPGSGGELQAASERLRAELSLSADRAGAASLAAQFQGGYSGNHLAIDWNRVQGDHVVPIFTGGLLGSRASWRRRALRRALIRAGHGRQVRQGIRHCELQASARRSGAGEQAPGQQGSST